MEIIGFNFNKISIEKFKPISGELKIDTNIKFDSIKKEKINLLGKKEDLRFSFTFTVLYNPDKMAELEFKGDVLILLEDKQINEILKNWKKKKISDEIRIPLFNFIFNKCNLKSLQLEPDLNLPFHIPMPKISSKNSSNSGYVR